MFPFNLFPYTNFHELNLDWIIKTLKKAVYTVNRTEPDENGNVNLPTVAGVSSVCGVGADGNGNVAINYSNVHALPDTINPVKKVNSINPDANGNVNVGTVKSVNGNNPDGSGAVVTDTLVNSAITLGPGLTGPGWTQYACKRGRVAVINISATNNLGSNLYGDTLLAMGAYPCASDYCNWLTVITDYDNPNCLAYVDENGYIYLQSWNYIPDGSAFKIIGTYLTE